MADLTATEVKNLNRRRENWMIFCGVVATLSMLTAVTLTIAHILFDVQIDAMPSVVLALIAMHQITSLEVSILTTRYEFTSKGADRG